MPPSRKVSNIQLSVIVTYLEKYKNIQLGTAVPKNKFAVKREQEHWVKLSRILNKCPGVTKEPNKWKHYWANMKFTVRNKAVEGKTLLPHEMRVMRLAGVLQKDKHGFSIMKYIKDYPEDSKVADHDEHSYSESVIPEPADQEIVIESTPSYTTDPMPVDEDVASFGSNTEEEDDANEEEQITEENTSHQGTIVPKWTEKIEQSCRKQQTAKMETIHHESNVIDWAQEVKNARRKEEEQITEEKESQLDIDVPEWVRAVEHSRLRLETRTTEALEKMSEGITSMAEAMKCMVGSLKMIEAAIRSTKRCNHISHST